MVLKIIALDLATEISGKCHGLDDFFGNLYHLNAEEDPEMYDWPPEKDFPEFSHKLGH